MIKERIIHIENKINSIREYKEQNKHLFEEIDCVAHSAELSRLKDELKWLNKLEIMTKTVTYDDTIIMKNILDKKHNSSLYKGTTWRELADGIINYVIPNFNAPLHYDKFDGKLLGVQEEKFIGGHNIEELLTIDKNYLWLTCNDKGRRYKTKLPIEVVDYIIKELKLQEVSKER